jgi:hypothetical protein
MSGSVVKKAICVDCGVDVRQNTYFCYNCGSSVVRQGPRKESIDSETREDAGDTSLDHTSQALHDISDPVGVEIKSKAALDRLTEQLSNGRVSGDGERRAEAATRRRRSRSVRNKGREFVWEPIHEAPGLLLYLVVGVILFLAAAAILLTVVWK